MAEQKNISSSYIRTYARDIEEVRSHNTPTKQTPVTTPKPKEPSLVSTAKPHTPTESKPSLAAITSEPIPQHSEPIKKTVTPPPAIPAFHQLKKDSPAVDSTNSGVVASQTPEEPAVHIAKPAIEQKTQPVAHEDQTLSQKFSQTESPATKQPATASETTKSPGFLGRLFGSLAAIFSRKAPAPVAPPDLADTEHEAHTAWSPFTEPGFDLLDAPDTPLAKPVPKVKTEPEPVWETQTPEPILTPVPKAPVAPPVPIVKEPVVPQPLPKPVIPTITQTPEPPEPPAPEIPHTPPTPTEDTKPKVETAPEPLAEISLSGFTAAPTASVDDEPAEYPMTESRETEVTDNTQVNPQPLSQKITPRFLIQSDTNTLAISLVVIVVITVATALILRSVIIHFSNLPDAPIERIQLTPLLANNSTIITIELNANTTSTLANTINQTVQSSTGDAAEIAIISPTQEELSTAYIFNLLNFDASASLTQSLTTTRLYTTQNMGPALLFSFADKETVYGGLLAWEQTLATDLRTIMPQLQTIPPTTSFADQTIGTVDVRVLTAGTEIVLVYGILENQNLVIIAPNTTVFSEAVSQAN